MAEFFNTPVTGQTDYRRYFYEGLPGMFSGMGSYLVLPWMNDLGAADTYTITMPGTPDADTEYVVSIGGVSVKFTTDSTPSAAELATGLYNAMRMDPQFYRLVDVELAANVITISNRILGTTLSITTNAAATANDLVIANTVTPVKGTTIPFGRFVGRKTSYKLDQKEGVSTGSLIDAAAGYEVGGVTVSTHHTQRPEYDPSTIAGYVFGDTMNVMEDTGTLKGIYVECVESDIQIGDSAYIDVTAANKGKLTKNTSGTVDISTKCRVMSQAKPTFNNTFIALVKFSRYK